MTTTRLPRAPSRAPPSPSACSLAFAAPARLPTSPSGPSSASAAAATPAPLLLPLLLRPPGSLPPLREGSEPSHAPPLLHLPCSAAPRAPPTPHRPRPALCPPSRPALWCPATGS
eukprot:2526348-Rhodomonas_salina.1